MSHLLQTVVCTLTLLAVAAPSRAEPGTAVATHATQARVRVDAIVIHGLFLTKPNVVTRELTFGEGDEVTIRDIELSVQRLRNLGIFRVANFELVDQRVAAPGERRDADNHRVLIITVDERWTIIPFGTFAAGGGVFSLTTGIYDINLLGRYLELGGHFQHFAGTNSFALWGSDPRFLGRRMSLSGSLSQTHRLHYFYDDRGDVEGGHARLTTSAALAYGVSWTDWLRSSVGVSFAADRFSTDLIATEVAEIERARGLPSNAHYLTLRLGSSVGRIDADSYLRHGVVFSWAASAARDGLLSNIDYLDNGVQLTAFAKLPLRANFGVRLGAAHTTLDRPEYHYFVGGFNAVRGFRHRRFHGTHYWYSNAELRVPSIDARWLVLQHVGFVDAAGVGGSFAALTELDAMSGGVGLRVLSPKIFSLIARVDLAWSLVGDGNSTLSFGAGQFF